MARLCVRVLPRGMAQSLLSEAWPDCVYRCWPSIMTRKHNEACSFAMLGLVAIVWCSYNQTSVDRFYCLTSPCLPSHPKCLNKSLTPKLLNKSLALHPKVLIKSLALHPKCSKKSRALHQKCFTKSVSLHPKCLKSLPLHPKCLSKNLALHSKCLNKSLASHHKRLNKSHASHP